MRPHRIMVLGDSLASGMQDDYTWRWRLAEHLRGTGVDAEFVGPHSGTFSMYEDPVLRALVEGRALPTGPEAANPMTGPYREGRFEGGHCARPGSTAHDAKDSVRAHVATGQPEFLLVQLGFNDLAMVGPPDVVLRDLEAVVAEARAAAPELVVLVADVAGTATWGTEWFRQTIDEFNERLPGAVAEWSTRESPVALVDVHSRFDAAADTYDEIHPNAAGELVMATAFADALLAFGIGREPLRPPRVRPSELRLTEPTVTAASGRAGSVRLEWNRVRGASGYRIALRDVTLGQPREVGPIPVLGDHWWARGLTGGHVYEFDVTAARGERLGPRSEPLRVTAGV
ncbi:hypothetical protein GCM10009839_38090 [Catenulispora yoronensis]|uniref:Fibronectin type-III domain-containing protein n=1 Tax=Catenulispora yoronensis TaxID=450799 RepID=A0ABP5FTX7_9ACTN